jgi:hypothetical protein
MKKLRVYDHKSNAHPTAAGRNGAGPSRPPGARAADRGPNRGPEGQSPAHSVKCQAPAEHPIRMAMTSPYQFFGPVPDFAL